jgi:hypothetical protein
VLTWLTKVKMQHLTLSHVIADHGPEDKTVPVIDDGETHEAVLDEAVMISDDIE